MRITRITLKSFLVLLLEILTAEISFSNGRQNGSYEVCYSVTGDEICYSVGNYTERTWNDAQRVCQDKNSFLPVIRNREEQRAFETYLKHLPSNALRTNYVWMSGKRKTHDNWTWINGQKLNRTSTISNGNSAEKTHMLINWPSTGTGYILKPERPLIINSYLCQYKGHQCTGQQHAVNATNGCLIPSGDGYRYASWYEARYDCLSKGGDLAILTDQDLQIFKNHRFPKHMYWIGLRKVNWVWKTNSQASPEEEVKYTKWAYEEMPTEEDLCISIAKDKDGQWRALRCSHKMPSVICEIRAATTTDSTYRNSTTATSAGNSHTTTVTIADTTNNHNDESSITVPAAIAVGIVIVILCIVVILVVICRKSKSSNDKTEPEEMESKNTNDSKDKKTKENPSKSTEEPSIYADIPLAEKNANDTVEGGQKGTVYASLDFNQGATYVEPSTLYANAQNVSGPIYPEPLNSTGNGSTSAGSSSAVKIGPMGDVYTLLMTNVAPSSDKTTERLIYANT